MKTENKEIRNSVKQFTHDISVLESFKNPLASTVELISEIKNYISKANEFLYQKKKEEHVNRETTTD